MIIKIVCKTRSVWTNLKRKRKPTAELKITLNIRPFLRFTLVVTNPAIK
jgi:hypothetical protein